MPSIYRNGGPVPVAPNDPDDFFFTAAAATATSATGGANCYAYATNYHGFINPGERSGRGWIHGGYAGGATAAGVPSAQFIEHCAWDSVHSIGRVRPGAAAIAGYQPGWLTALFSNAGDMHWARLDSQGNWSDKMPGDYPRLSTFAPANPDTILAATDWVTALIFRGYFWVDAAVPARPKACCCYLTTASCGALGLPDDCDELETLRKFRDEVLLPTREGAEDVARYYATAPGIVAAIDARADAKVVYEALFREWIQPAVLDVKRGDGTSAYLRFKLMVETLGARYL